MLMRRPRASAVKNLDGGRMKGMKGKKTAIRKGTIFRSGLLSPSHRGIYIKKNFLKSKVVYGLITDLIRGYLSLPLLLISVYIA